MTLARDEQLGLPQPRDFDPPDPDLVTSDLEWDEAGESSRTLPESQQPNLYEEDLRLDEEDQRELSGIRIAPPAWRQSSWFLPLESWRGHVLDTHDDTFTARLISSDLETEEDAEFEVDEIASSDRELVVPGAVFYWNVGYRIDPGGRRSRTSLLTFRRLPAFSQKEITAAEERAASIAAELNWHNPDAAALTAREKEILQLLAAGVSATDELADRLYISQKTLERHLASIFQKLAVTDRSQAAVEAIRIGLEKDATS